MSVSPEKLIDRKGASVANNSDFIDTYKQLKSTLEQKQVFVKCSGYQTLLSACDHLKEGKISEAILQGIMQGPQTALEKYTSTLDEAAVYASLFLASAIPLLFSPPAVITALDPDDGWLISYYVLILCSVVFCIICVITAILTTGTKNKLLRDSDALAFLWYAEYHSTISGISLLLGILCMFGALVPVLYTSVGTNLTIALMVIVGVMLIPLALWMNSLRLKRHAKYYYMDRNGSVKERHTDGAVNVAHDPYDPVLAVKVLQAYAELGRLMASRDENIDGIVQVCETDQVFNAEVFKNLEPLPSE